MGARTAPLQKREAGRPFRWIQEPRARRALLSRRFVGRPLQKRSAQGDSVPAGAFFPRPDVPRPAVARRQAGPPRTAPAGNLPVDGVQTRRTTPTDRIRRPLPQRGPPRRPSSPASPLPAAACLGTHRARPSPHGSTETERVCSTEPIEKIKSTSWRLPTRG